MCSGRETNMNTYSHTSLWGRYGSGVSPLEMSVAQCEIWLAQQVRPNQSFSVGTYAEVEGRVDQNVLAQAVALVVRETPALRTQFERVGGEVLRFIGSVPGHGPP